MVDQFLKDDTLSRWTGMFRRSAYAVCVFVALGSSQTAWSSNQSYVGVTADFKTGDFGTDNTTDLYSINIEYGSFNQDYDASLDISYLSLHDVYAGTETGVGDVLVRAGIKLSTEPAHAYGVAFGVVAKLPTADEDKGLGTGETDVGVNLGISKQLDTIILSLDLGYVLVGDPPGIDYENSTQYSLGIFRGWQRVGAYASFNGRTAMLRDMENPLEFSFGGFYLLNSKFSVMTGAFIGLSDGSPDYGLLLGFTSWL